MEHEQIVAEHLERMEEHLEFVQGVHDPAAVPDGQHAVPDFLFRDNDMDVVDDVYPHEGVNEEVEDDDPPGADLVEDYIQLELVEDLIEGDDVPPDVVDDVRPEANDLVDADVLEDDDNDEVIGGKGYIYIKQIHFF